MRYSADKKYDIAVIGGGHAGCEASLAASRMGMATILVTMSRDNLGMLSCNPAIGGIGKGQLVKEVDALGGEIGKAADYAGIQFRQLNSSKGAAVRSSRCQTDRKKYKFYMGNVVSKQENLEILEDKVIDIVVNQRRVKGIVTKENGFIQAKSVIVSAGTFLNGLIHVGLKSYPGGRAGEQASSEMSGVLLKLGIKLLRFKTGTCARIDGRSIDFSVLEKQEPDAEPLPFSFSNNKIRNRQVPCYITYTNKNTHDIIRSNLNRSPLYTGVIKSTGVRYCPSIEDKIVRFPDRQRHQVFIEPEGLDTYEYYPNGLATSLPRDAQDLIIKSIRGLEHARIIKYGYGIEHDVVDSRQLFATLESKDIANLYFAGQINGTTGYEEAAALGIMAGINSAMKIKGKRGLVLDRARAYIGVLIDDLVTKGTNEPYRMFTSRVEYRLLLRENNADIRLRSIGYQLGLVNDNDYRTSLAKKSIIEKKIKEFRKIGISPDEKINDRLTKSGLSRIARKISIYDFLKRPHVSMGLLRSLGVKGVENEYLYDDIIESEIKYEGYIDKQSREIRRFRDLERMKIPKDLDFTKISGLSNEIKEKLRDFRPMSLGHASRIQGVTPAAVSILMVYLKK